MSKDYDLHSSKEGRGEEPTSVNTAPPDKVVETNHCWPYENELHKQIKQLTQECEALAEGVEHWAKELHNLVHMKQDVTCIGCELLKFVKNYREGKS